MYDKGRHDRHTAAHQRSRYHLRQGMALLAREVKRTGKPVEDSVGRPLKYCNEMAQRHGTKRIEAWARGATTSAVTMTVDQTNPKAARWPA